ncbi:MAG: helical backbone metal receptor [Gemmatimonadota bacterium]|nr:helical backbone metal receptor [Gemmatimonadota bacterium]
MTLRLLPFLALAAGTALACTAREAPSADSSRDDFGAAIRPAAVGETMRIVSLNPATTELIFALGAGSLLVGRSHWDIWPDSAKLVADLGPALRPNLEAVLARDPDLVVLYGSEDNRAPAARLREAGIQTIALRVDRIADFRRAVHLLGAATGRLAPAAGILDSVDRSLARVRAATASAGRPTVFVHLWDRPIITSGANDFLTELLDIAGARNVYDDLTQPSPQVSLEDVVRRDPDFVLTGPLSAPRISADAAWRAVPAVRSGRILVFDTALVARPSVKLGEAALSLARLLHPELRL